ncbi:hypothetical protein DMN91_004633 [Ooceraea biroi]|uniref:Laccase-4 n=1 Tax=Ooceraea biroi TaxID=2015173 RepID=A0A3L8DPJ1_OOCBI|nr:hypothetical protein DMN91_004633 [Ooceraea biroi]
MIQRMVIRNLLLVLLCVYKSRSETIITAYNDEFGLTPIDPEIADEVDWGRHACRRMCEDDETPLNCYYTFKLESYHAMSKACYDCPFNITDCFRPHCIPADGIKRSLLVINRQMPGLPIEVCQGDRIIVDMINSLHAESTTMHWHGQHHLNSPYMDGVPYVSQCPIPPGATFRYNYVATEVGTHFWHSHIGFQRGDGVFGPLIVRAPPKSNWHKDLYDFDEYTVVVADWVHEIGLTKFLAHHHADGDNKAPNVLINGLGRFIALEGDNETLANMPLTTFVVKPNSRYRFRLINAEFLNCPIEVSVDNHTLLVISSDGRDIEPVQAESLVSYAGERFDFVIEANQPVDNYWMRFRGLMDCDERFLSAHQVAILRYEGAPEEEPTAEVTYKRVRNDSYGLVCYTSIFADYLDSAYKKPAAQSSKNNFDKFAAMKDTKQRLLTPQLNHISMKLPAFPLLIERDLIEPTQFCNSSTVVGCEDDYCACTHVLQVKTNSVVELVLVDEGVPYDANHPFHLHGYLFRVVAMKRIGNTTTVDEVKKLDRQGLIRRKLARAPLKDTVTVPDGGYTIVRFYADNPGYWLFHCHIEFHAEIGMSLIFKVGEHEEMLPVPRNFPRCGDWKPTNGQEESNSETSIISTTERAASKNESVSDEMDGRFLRYLMYLELFVKQLQSSSASSLSVTWLLLVTCLLISVIRIHFESLCT